MKKIDWKKILIFTLVIVLAFMLVACNGKKKDDPTPTPTPTPQGVPFSEVLNEMVDGLDALFASVWAMEENLNASATVFVKTNDMDFEVKLSANLGAAVQSQEVLIEVKTDGEFLVGIYAKGDVVYINDKLTGGALSVNEEGVMSITPAANAKKLKVSLTNGFGDDSLSSLLQSVPAMLGALLPEETFSIRGNEMIGTMLPLVGGILNDYMEVTEGEGLNFTARLKMAEIGELVGLLAGLFGGDDGDEQSQPVDPNRPEGIMGLLYDLVGGDASILGLVDIVANLILGGTVQDVLDGNVTNYPTIKIGCEYAGTKVSGLSLDYEFAKADDDDMKLLAGLKNVSISAIPTTASILPSDLNTYAEGAAKVSLGVSVPGQDLNLGIDLFVKSLNDSEAETVGVEATVTLAGQAQDVLAYATLIDGVVYVLFDLAEAYDEIGVTAAQTKYVVQIPLFVSEDIPNAEGDASEGLDIMGMLPLILDLLMGDTLADLLKDMSLSIPQALDLVSGIVGIESEVLIGEVSGLLEMGLALAMANLDIPGDDYVGFLGDILGVEFTADDLAALLFSETSPVGLKLDLLQQGLGGKVSLMQGTVSLLEISGSVTLVPASQVPSNSLVDTDADDDYDQILEDLKAWLLDILNPIA